MTNQIYREQMLQHYKNPQNQGSLEDANCEAELKNLSCGDEIKMYLKIKDKKIIDIKFEGKGCAVCIASASLLTEDIKGEDISKIKDLKYEYIEKLLGISLTPSRIKCAHLGLLTVQKALEDNF